MSEQSNEIFQENARIRDEKKLVLVVKEVSKLKSNAREFVLTWRLALKQTTSALNSMLKMKVVLQRKHF